MSDGDSGTETPWRRYRDAHSHPELLALAEDGDLRDALTSDRRFVAWMGMPMYPELRVVRRLRLRSPIARDVDEIRSVVGRGAHWMVGWSARPDGLADHLREIGMHDEEQLAAMVLTAPPQDAAAPGVGVRPVTSAEDMAAVIRIQHDAFAADGPPRIDLAQVQLSYDQSTGQSLFYLAFIEGAPVACGRATFTSAGVQLNGGATLPSARGRGAYRAVVLARWREAVRRGTPALTTQARASSRPILKRIGFREVGRIDALIDAA